MKLSDCSLDFLKDIKGGALLGAADGRGGANVMTVSWGGTGVLWGKEVCFLFVRESRYTYPLCEKQDVLTLSFLNEDKRSCLGYCGTKSGRDVDKFKECGLEYRIENGAVILKDAKATLILKKLYSQMMERSCFTTDEALEFYKDGDFHKVYACEITDVIN